MNRLKENKELSYKQLDKKIQNMVDKNTKLIQLIKQQEKSINDMIRILDVININIE